MKLTTLILAICAVFSIRAQIGSVDIIDRFEEGRYLRTSVRLGDHIITGGQSLDNLYYRPTVVCSDTNGTVIWNSALLGGLPYNNESVQLLHVSADGFIYGVCSLIYSNVVFKLNPVNGAVIWTKNLEGVTALKDYGQNIACVADGSGPNAIALKILDAATGTELSSHVLGNNYVFNFEVDENLNVYYASSDTIIKRNHSDLNLASWKVKYTAQNMNEIKRIFYDTISGKIIGFGKTNSGAFKILIVDTLAGSVLNSLTPSGGFTGLSVVAIKVKNDDVYFATTTSTISQNEFKLVKLNLPTATISWVFYETPTLNDVTGIVDFELDSQDNVYCYGHYNNTLSNGANLSIIKVTPTGTLSYIKQYSYNTTLDNASYPYRSFLINNNLYLTAYMQGKYLGDKGGNAKLIKVDLLTGDSVFTASMGGTTINSSSEVKFFVKHPDGGFVAFSRKGQLLNVQRFDNNNSPVWDVNFSQGSTEAYHPVAAVIAPNGQILIGLHTTNVNDLNNLAISGSTYDVMVMMLDANGNQMMEESFYGMFSSSPSAKIVDVLFDGTQFFALINDYAGVSKQVKISMSGQVTYPYPNLVQFSYTANQKKYFANYNTANYMILGNNGSGNPASIKIYAKNDMSIQDLKVCPSYATQVHTFKEIGTTSLLIGGVGASGEFLFLMNKTTGAIIWEKPAIATGNTIKVIDMELDPTGTYAYVLSENDFSSIVRRYNVQTGYAMQTNTKAFSSSFGYRPKDLAVNGPTDQVVVGCSRDNYTAASVEGYYYIMTSNLLQQSDAVFGSSVVNNQAPAVNAVYFNPSNGLILGGIKQNTNAAKGVIEFATCVENGTLNVTACGQYVCPINNVNYTTSGTYSIFEQTSSLCDSLYTLNLTITQPSTGNDIQTACDSLVWAVNGQTYTVSGQYIDTIPNASGCDSIITLDLTIIPSLPLTIENSFSMPSDANSCVGQTAISISGNADFELNLDNGSQLVNSNGYSLITGLCSGIHDLKVTDNCSDTLSVSLVIPVDSNYVFTNPFIDSLVQDSLGITLSNCNIYYGGIDTAYIDSIWANGNTVNVIWNIVDSNGSNFDTTSYVLNNGTGVYWLQLSVFCPNKSLGEYFTVTEAIYFNNGDIETANLAEKEGLLFKLHPNPTSDHLILFWNGTYGASVEIIDVTGAFIRRCEVSSGESISVTDLSNAIYYLKWTGNGKSSVCRFVKN